MERDAPSRGSPNSSPNDPNDSNHDANDYLSLYLHFHNLEPKIWKKTLLGQIQLRKLLFFIDGNLLAEMVSYLPLAEQVKCWGSCKAFYDTRENPILWENTFVGRNTRRVGVFFQSRKKPLSEIFYLVRHLKIAGPEWSFSTATFHPGWQHFQSLQHLELCSVYNNDCVAHFFNLYGAQINQLTFRPTYQLVRESYASVQFQLLTTLNLEIYRPNVCQAVEFLEHLVSNAPSLICLVIHIDCIVRISKNGLYFVPFCERLVRLPIESLTITGNSFSCGMFRDAIKQNDKLMTQLSTLTVGTDRIK